MEIPYHAAARVALVGGGMVSRGDRHTHTHRRRIVQCVQTATPVTVPLS